ncbi:RRM_1 domain-containing protein/La domain-containing protein/PAM2 domain-containing protein [Cephalotus follicularis]|uniref:RRM_1 domain-containing protein/La domain-containing protein/PAM2 domain-containing protein n=1 Tax=Cephalotus follicularis TaxID=3775 RepID=A0A1Q3B047_CEPFO|nr:RRM_1 domain-containing protein/La domain-containing protein/PAM2 domain-containing protein [Cephalotus follicularis]
MAHSQPERPKEHQENEEMKETISSSSNSCNDVSFKFNAQAPEFVPRVQTHMSISGYFYPSCYHYLGGAGGSDWFFVGDQEPTYLISSPSLPLPSSSKDTLNEDLKQKIIKQVEYQFSDMSLLANESMAKSVHKDPEGYVPISVISSIKKIKSLISNNQLLAQALLSSSKLVVSEDGKKVRRKFPFTDRDKEELQSRTIVVENLPEDHSHQNLEKLFSVVGSVKTVRICHPPESNSSRSKGDFFLSNKLHALVEYESTQIAERAVEKLNDERNWRKGLRVRLLLRCSPKSVLKTKKSDFDGILEEDELPPEAPEDSSPSNCAELTIMNNAEEISGGSKKGWAKGRGKGRGRVQSQIGRGLLAAASPQSSSAIQCEASPKQTSKGPRMPDGTRGFTMGRGKPLSTPSLVTTSMD